MLQLARISIIALGFMASAAMADYSISRSSQMSDGQNGTATFNTKGAFTATGHTLSIEGGFTNFVLLENPRIKATGDVKSANTAAKDSGEHSLNGKVTLEVSPAIYNVEFQNLKVARVGNAITYGGTLLVNGKSYPIGTGTAAASIVNAIITYMEE
jgi:hypothetical protein